MRSARVELESGGRSSGKCFLPTVPGEVPRPISPPRTPDDFRNQDPWWEVWNRL